MNEQSRVSKFLKNAGSIVKNPRMHNVYHIETFDADGNRTNEAFGLNLLTNNGFLAITSTWMVRDPVPYIVKFGTGTTAPDPTDTALEQQVDAFTSTSNVRYKDQLSILYDSTNSMILGMARMGIGYIEYNVTGITSDVDITEIGLVFYGNENTLLTRSLIYDELGQVTHITKEVNQRLKVTIYLVSAIPESVITSAYDNEKYILATPYGLLPIQGASYGSAYIRYSTDFLTYMSDYIYGTRGTPYYGYTMNFPFSFTYGVSDGTVTMTSSRTITLTNKYDYVSKSIFETNPSNITSPFPTIIFDAGSSSTLHCLEREYLPNQQTESITAYDVFVDNVNSDSISKSFGQYHIDSTRTTIMSGRHVYDHIGIIPVVDFDMSSSYMYNYLTKDWDIQDSTTNATTAWYGKDFTAILQGAYLSTDPDEYGDTTQVYVYVNTHNSIPITSMNLTVQRQLFATDKWWDKSTYVQISDPSNIAAALQTKKYYVTLSDNAGYIDDTRNQTTHQITCTEGTVYTPSETATATIQVDLSLYPLVRKSVNHIDGTLSGNAYYLTFDTDVYLHSHLFELYNTMNVTITTVSGKAIQYYVNGYDNSEDKNYVGAVGMYGGNTDVSIPTKMMYYKNFKIEIRYIDGGEILPEDISAITITLKNLQYWKSRKYGKVLRSNTNGWVALQDRLLYPNSGTPTAFMYRQSDNDEFISDPVGDIRFATDDRLIINNAGKYRKVVHVNAARPYTYPNSLRVFTVSSNVENPSDPKDVMLDFTDYTTDANFIGKAMIWTWSDVGSNEAYIACNNPWSNSTSFNETCVLQVYNVDGNGIPQQIKLQNTSYGQIIDGTKYVIGIVPNSSPTEFVVYDASDGTLYDTFNIPTGYTMKNKSLRATYGCAYFAGYIGSDYMTFVYNPQSKTVTSVGEYIPGLDIIDTPAVDVSSDNPYGYILSTNGIATSGGQGHLQTIYNSDAIVSGVPQISYGYPNRHPAEIASTANTTSFSYLFKGDDYRTNAIRTDVLCASYIGFENGQIVTSKNGKHKLIVASKVSLPEKTYSGPSTSCPCVIDVGASIDGTYKWDYWPYANRYPEDTTLIGLTEFDNNIIMYKDDGSVIYKSIGRFLPHKVTGATRTITAYNNPKNIGNKTITVKLDPYS